ncbi:MAG: glycosyltransferase family 2 protein [Pseudobdellovibrionaceae bacterium]
MTDYALIHFSEIELYQIFKTVGEYLKASVVIRTYNEEQYLEELLASVEKQQCSFPVEVVIVDSGSTDRTLSIAKTFQNKIELHLVHIKKELFSFGRSLNMGCDAALGTHLIFISGHCVPQKTDWLQKLLEPFQKITGSALQIGSIAYVYGRQLGGPESKFSETQLFEKYFPDMSRVPQDGFFCNNANAALPKEIWAKFPFDEELTGLEDMYLAKRLVREGYKIGYVAEAPVYHYHHETWSGVRRRYERESLALQHIMPEIHLTFVDFLRYFFSGFLHDSASALERRTLVEKVGEIFLFRLMQYWGSYKGNNDHRKLSQKTKDLYFYPKKTSEVC